MVVRKAALARVKRQRQGRRTVEGEQLEQTALGWRTPYGEEIEFVEGSEGLWQTSLTPGAGIEVTFQSNRLAFVVRALQNARRAARG
jgi:hypothetical protein